MPGKKIYGVKFCLLKSTVKLDFPPTEPWAPRNDVKSSCVPFQKPFFFLNCIVCFYRWDIPLQYSFNWAALYRRTSIRLYVNWKNVSYLLIRKAVIMYILCRFSIICCLILVVPRCEMSWILREACVCGEQDLASLGFYCQCVLCTKILSVGILIKERILNISYPVQNFINQSS